MVSVHVLGLFLKIKYNSTFLFHRTGAVQIAPQQRPGSTTAILCHHGEAVLQRFSLILPQFKAKSFTVEICQMNTFLFVYFQFAHGRYLQAVHTFIFGKDICGKRLSELLDVGSYVRYSLSAGVFHVWSFPNHTLPKSMWYTAKPHTSNLWIQSRDII